ncbi:hypothetical protein EDC96DRAFT_589817, partial [Choanephora cucurbitarum]
MHPLPVPKAFDVGILTLVGELPTTINGQLKWLLYRCRLAPLNGLIAKAVPVAVAGGRSRTSIYEGSTVVNHAYLEMRYSVSDRAAKADPRTIAEYHPRVNGTLHGCCCVPLHTVPTDWRQCLVRPLNNWYMSIGLKAAEGEKPITPWYDPHCFSQDRKGDTKGYKSSTKTMLTPLPLLVPLFRVMVSSAFMPMPRQASLSPPPIDIQPPMHIPPPLIGPETIKIPTLPQVDDRRSDNGSNNDILSLTDEDIISLCHSIVNEDSRANDQDINMNDNSDGNEEIKPDITNQEDEAKDDDSLQTVASNLTISSARISEVSASSLTPQIPASISLEVHRLPSMEVIASEVNNQDPSDTVDERIDISDFVRDTEIQEVSSTSDSDQDPAHHQHVGSNNQVVPRQGHDQAPSSSHEDIDSHPSPLPASLPTSDVQVEVIDVTSSPAASSATLPTITHTSPLLLTAPSTILPSDVSPPPPQHHLKTFCRT